LTPGLQYKFKETKKSQGRDPIIFEAPYFYNGARCVYVLFLLFFFTTFIAFIILPVFYGRFCLK